MKSLKLNALLLAVLAASAAWSAQAQNAPMSPPMNPQSEAAAPMDRTDQAPRMRDRQGERADRAERAEQRTERMQIRVAQGLAALKVKLRLAAAQQGAWNTFTQAVQPSPGEIGRMMQARMQMRSLTTPERIDRMRAMRGEMAAAMDQRFDATKAFYAELSPEQQKTFDANAMRWMAGGQGGAHGRRGGGMRHHGDGSGSDKMMEHHGERRGG